MAKVVKAFPPNWNELAKVFPIKGRPGIIYAYGPRIYNPSGVALNPWILAHEEEHCKRQNEIGVCSWWQRYADSVRFRLAEEVIAHKVEWQTVQDAMPYKDASRYLEQMITRLSSPLYGSMVDVSDARFLIMGYI